MNNEEIAEKVADMLHRFGYLKNNTDDGESIVRNQILNLLEFEERKILEKLGLERKR